MPTPTVGTIVHLRSYGTPRGTCCAAIVTVIEQTRDEDDTVRVGLAILRPEGIEFNRDCLQDETATHGGTWHWPEKKD